MIGIIWNCQGLGKEVKSEFLRDIIRREKINFIGLQETNKKNFDDSWLNFISGHRNFAWVWSPPNGRSGGLLVGFDADMFDVREKELGEFMIRILLIQKESGFIWNFINVYGAAQNDQKYKFLSELSSFCSKCSHPMLMGGDLNILRKESDKNKPGGTNKWSSLFNSIIDVHDLIELDLSGRLFTWSNNRNPPLMRSWTYFLLARSGICIIIMLMFLVLVDPFLIMCLYVSKLILLPLLGEILDMSYVGGLDLSLGLWLKIIGLCLLDVKTVLKFGKKKQSV
jgi:hypothetical protein